MASIAPSAWAPSPAYGPLPTPLKAPAAQRRRWL